MTTALAIAANSIDMKPLSLRDSVFGVVVKMPLCSSGVLLRGTFGGEYTGGTDTGGTYTGGSSTGAANSILDTSLIRPLLWVTFMPKNRVEFSYSGRKRMTNVSVSDGVNGELKFPLMTSLSPS